MSELLTYYQRPEPATWVFVSSFLLLSIYFVFHRIFCVRNLDILLLLCLAPGLMMVYEGRRMQLAGTTVVAPGELAHQPAVAKRHRDADGQRLSAGTETRFVHWVSNAQPAPSGAANPTPAYRQSSRSSWNANTLEFYGFVAVLAACALLMIRMLVDPALTRRPLLVPNLSIGGLIFIGVSLFLFLMANVVTSSPKEQHERGPALGPGYVLLNMLPSLPTTPVEVEEGQRESSNAAAIAATRPWLPNIARILAILSNLAIVFGIVGVGYWHFDNVKTGIGCAVMYLLLPYTAQMTGNLEHSVPAAFLVLSLLMYRQPMIAGGLLGLAAGLVYYPLFLMPLWISFYWHRGLGRWLTGLVASLAALVILLAFAGSSFAENISRMFGLWLPYMGGLEGVWSDDYGIAADFRIPVLVGCILLSGSFVFWPPRKTLASLMCGSAAIMLAVQFWHGFGGGLFMAWFLPFILLTVFRPNLDDRIASNVVSQPRGNGGGASSENTAQGLA